MTYKIGDMVHRDENGAFPSDLSQWLNEHNACLTFTIKSDGTYGYEICSLCNDPAHAQEAMYLKAHLSDSDYLAIKYAEGELTEEEYAPIRTLRRQWRQRINELEGN